MGSEMCIRDRWLVREICLQESAPGGTLFNLIGEGVRPATMNGESRDLGVFAGFDIIASDPEAALKYAMKFVEPSILPSLRISECEVLEENCTDPKGVYEVRPYFTYDPDRMDDDE